MILTIAQPPNAWLPIVVTESGIMILVIPLLTKTHDSILVNEHGLSNVILDMLLDWKAESPIFVTELEICTLVIAEPWNALLLILTTELGIVRLVRCTLFPNAAWPILVT